MVAPSVGQLRMEGIEDSGQTAHSRIKAPTIARPSVTHLGGVGEGVETSVQHLLANLARRRRMISTVVVCGTVLLALAASLISPVYTAFAQIGVILPTGPTAGSAWGDQRASQVIIDTHMVMLKSRDFLREVLVSMDAGAQAASARELDLRLEQFERRLTISQSLSSGVISVAYASKSPEQAAEIANRVVTLYRVQLRKREADALRAELDQLGYRIQDIDRAGKATRAQIQAHLLELSTAVPASPGDSKEQLGRLEMEARANAQLQVDLLRRHVEIRQRLEAPPQQIWIVSLAAVPVTPSSLPRWVLIIPAGMLLLIGSCFWAIASEQLDQRLRSASDVTTGLSVPCLGLVPRAPCSPFWRPGRCLDEHLFTPHAESIRSVAAGLGATECSHPAHIVFLSACEEGEGLTRLAVSVAHYTASIGRRVLLVDLDARTPGVLHELTLEAAHDVVDLVLNDAAPETVVRRHPVLAFDYLPMKAGRVDPLSLVASGKLNAALQAFRASYDLVFIAGPSALRPEAPLLAAMSDQVLFIVKWGSTRREVAQKAVRLLWDRNPVRHDPRDFMAAVVTDVPTKAHARELFGDADGATVTRGHLLRVCGNGRSLLKSALKRFRSGSPYTDQRGQ
jgi:succinoglycan biosynthesis transport protein ExoP